MADDVVHGLDTFDSELAKKKNVELEAELKVLSTAVRKLHTYVSLVDERERRRAEYANRLIVETMFAVVRLEIATASIQIVNNALAIKREITGSGKAELVFDITGTLVMLAGNVLSGGGMSLLGNLIVAAGEMVKSGAKNDKVGLGKAVMKGASAGFVLGMKGKEAYQEQERNIGFGQRLEVNDNKVELQDEWESIGELLNNGVDQVFEPAEITVVRRKTFFISHGAGGSSAIETDVKEAIAYAYAQTLNNIADELKNIGQAGPNVNLGAKSILSKIINTPLNEKATLHPVTSWVIETALTSLASNKNNAAAGYAYAALAKTKGGTTAKAEAKVRTAYAKMWANGAILTPEELKKAVFP